MIEQFVISLLTSLSLWFGPAPTPAAPSGAILHGREIAQSASKLAAADRLASRIGSLEADRRRAQAEKSKLAKTHDDQLADIERLKRRRASWRRDRMLKERLADAQKTADRLVSVSTRIRSIDKSLRAARTSLVREAKIELSRNPSASRRAKLTSWSHRAQRALRVNKKIILPDDTIDPLADPEDLEFQADRIAQSERELEQEIRELTARAGHFRQQDELRRKSERAAEAGRFDDNRTRRSTGRISSGRNGTGGGAGLSADDDAAGADPAPNEQTPQDPGGFTGESDPVVVLADVVDAGTLDALRRARLSGNPAARAKAAERARKQVRQRLERLRNQRKKMLNRASKLRR